MIVDDDALIRDSLKIILGMEDDIEVCGVAANGQEAFKVCSETLPEVVLMDIRMPVMDGVLGTKLIKDNFQNVKVIILTTFKDDEYIKEALKSGAEGYVLKNQSSDSIIECIRAVSKGNSVFHSDIAEKLSTMMKEQKTQDPRCKGLTPRELDIMKLIGEGLSNKEIAEKLFLSEGTVRNYVTMLLEKLEMRDRTQLAIFYVRNYEM
jgi:DNA-binding NarL/FixJ family response regulator